LRREHTGRDEAACIVKRRSFRLISTEIYLHPAMRARLFKPCRPIGKALTGVACTHLARSIQRGHQI
jgi:hypothetical protein